MVDQIIAMKGIVKVEGGTPASVLATSPAITKPPGVENHTFLAGNRVMANGVLGMSMTLKKGRKWP